MDPHTCLKDTLKNKYHRLNEAYSNKTLLPLRLCYKKVQYEPNELPNLRQHEIRYVDNSDLPIWVVFPTIPLVEVLSCDCKHDSSKRTVLTLGVCGVGKTTTVQRFALEWAEGRGYQDIPLLFPLTFWELNLVQTKLSLIELLQTFYPELKDLDDSSLDESNVWFVLDGLDEYRFPLNFSCASVTDATEVSTVNVLLTNLIRGDLLPRAHIWVTTRYAAAPQIPDTHVLKETGLQGFNDEQMEQHFRTVIGNDHLADRAVDHVKISRSLDFLCKVPSICTIVAHVLKDHVSADNGFKINPLNLTQIYTKLFEASEWDVVGKVKTLALHEMGECNVMYERDLRKHDISVDGASAFSKLHPLVLRHVKGLYHTSVFRFGHASVQEFLAASTQLENIATNPMNSDRSTLCQYLVDQALENTEGKYDVYLRFIFGLIKVGDVLEPKDPLFGYTKRKILENITQYSAVALFHCLREYDLQALQYEIRFFVEFGMSPIRDFTPMHWQYMVQRSRNFEGMKESFEMEVSTRCDERLLRQIPAIMKSRKAKLRFSNLTDKSGPALAAVLSTRESYLRELDLGYNSISDSGVKMLVEGLSDPNCRLKTLRLPACELTSHACIHLSKALRQSQKLLELDLSRNQIGCAGLRYLANGLKDPECHLQTLRLSQCNIEERGCFHLASALKENSDHLQVLDLSINMIGDKGANELFQKIEIWMLRKLEMYHCGLTALSCRRIGEALKNESSTLAVLNVSNNNLKDEGLELICEGMYAWCSLQKLNVSRCGISGRGCFYLAKVLCSISQLYSESDMQKTGWQAVELKELDLSMNSLGDRGVGDMAAGLKNPYSHLETLDLSYCSLTDDCCVELAMGLASKESIVSEVDMSGNDLQDKGVKKLCVGLKNPQCKLEKLSLRSCGLTSRSIQFLTTALKANPQHLAELHLMGNNLDHSAVTALHELTKNLKYTLHTIDVTD